MGPGCPTVLIGGMPAAVMGDMCVCTGPPDTIALGSTGVMIGGKPAARMGDMCAHGGSIVVGCPTVLIGEVAPGGGAGVAAGEFTVEAAINAIVLELKSSEGGAEGVLALRQNLTLQQAAMEGIPFCEVCEPPSNQDEQNQSKKVKEEKKNPKITNLVWMKGDQIIDSSKVGRGVKVRAQVQDIDDGEELTFLISDPSIIGDGVEPIELKGKVKGGYAEVDWEVVEPYTDEDAS